MILLTQLRVISLDVPSWVNRYNAFAGKPRAKFALRWTASFAAVMSSPSGSTMSLSTRRLSRTKMSRTKTRLAGEMLVANLNRAAPL
jgi:hypothetical protein